MPPRSRAHMAVVIVGGTLGIFVLLLLQVFLPFELGLGGLVAVAALDLILFLAYRHRRVVRRVPPGYLPGMRERDRQRLAARRANAGARKIAGTALVVLFVLGIYTAGWIIRAEAMANGSGLGPYFLGASMSLIGGGLIILIFNDYYGTKWGWRAIQLESTEDD